MLRHSTKALRTVFHSHLRKYSSVPLSFERTELDGQKIDFKQFINFKHELVYNYTKEEIDVANVISLITYLPCNLGCKPKKQHVRCDKRSNQTFDGGK
jgi:hypothetical protein